MINLIKKISISLVIFFSITGLASAETTISAEGQYIFNTLGFYLGGVLEHLWLQVFVCLSVVW